MRAIKTVNSMGRINQIIVHPRKKYYTATENRESQESLILLRNVDD